MLTYGIGAVPRLLIVPKHIVYSRVAQQIVGPERGKRVSQLD